MKALILAAGKGTRLKELTAKTPKPMLRVGDAPLLAHHVRSLGAAGVTNIAINVHHAPEVIVGYFGDGSTFGMHIKYSYERYLLGTAGAAKKLQHFLDESFFVVYGDVFTNVDLAGLALYHTEQKRRCGAADALTMLLYRVPNPTECGLVDVDEQGRVQRFVEKPPPEQVFTDLANAGVLVCDPGVLDLIPAKTVYDFGRDLIPAMLDRQMPVFARAIGAGEYVIDIGTPAGFQRAQCLASSLADRPSVDRGPAWFGGLAQFNPT